jgi:hypothetical protein
MRGVGSLLVVGAAAAALASTANGHSGAKPAACGKLLAPTNGIYLGANPDFSAPPSQLEGDTVTSGAIEDFASQAGHRPVVIAFVQHWFKGLEFPRDKVMTVWRAGAVPFVRMHAHAGSPYGQGNPPEQLPGDYSLQNIIDGKFDARLRTWADAARDTDIPIIANYGDEENADWGAWAGTWNGGGTTTGYGDQTFPDGPERYRDAFRHLVTLFREEGATNVTWVFHMVEWFSPNPPWQAFANYYPGDEYVDWVALSTFGEPNQPDGSTSSFEQILSTFHASDYPGIYTDITSLGSGTKPLALQYTGVKEVRPGFMADWISGMFATLKSGRYPRVGLMSWYSSDDYGTRLDMGAGAASAFQAGAADPLFGAKPQFSGNCMPLSPTSVKLVGKRLSWRAVPNAVSYEVWRKGRRVASTASTAYTGPRGAYRVRAVNPLGFGPFAAAH